MVPALILTAGHGRRLDPLTRLVAKPAVPVAGRALVERALAWLGRSGVHDVVLNLHHKPDTITAIVGDGSHLGLRVRYSWERELLGSAGGPRHALPLLDAPAFVIANGDTLCDIDVAALVAAHERSRAGVTMAVTANPAQDRYNGIELGPDGRVRCFVPRGHQQPTWHFVGVQVVNADVFASLADGVPAETVSGLYQDRLTAHGDVFGWKTDAPFIDIGTPRDYLEANRRLSSGPLRSVVWPDAEIADGADLDGCIVAGPVRVPAGFHGRDSVLVPSAVVRPGELVEQIGDVAVFPL